MREIICKVSLHSRPKAIDSIVKVRRKRNSREQRFVLVRARRARLLGTPLEKGHSDGRVSAGWGAPRARASSWPEGPEGPMTLAAPPPRGPKHGSPPPPWGDPRRKGKTLPETRPGLPRLGMCVTWVSLCGFLMSQLPQSCTRGGLHSQALPSPPPNKKTAQKTSFGSARRLLIVPNAMCTSARTPLRRTEMWKALLSAPAADHLDENREGLRHDAWDQVPAGGLRRWSAYSGYPSFVFDNLEGRVCMLPARNMFNAVWTNGVLRNRRKLSLSESVLTMPSPHTSNLEFRGCDSSSKP